MHFSPFFRATEQSGKRSGQARRRQRMVAWLGSGLLHRNDDLCATSELYTGELRHTDEPPFSLPARRCCAETAYCKRLFQVFQMFYRYVASVLYQCCKNISGCCNGVSSVCSKCSTLFSDVCCKSRYRCCIYMHVASVCFKCFIRMLQVFYLDVAYVLQWLHSVFLMFQTYVASVLTVSDVCCMY
jgi:hypothetical protein